MISFRIGIFIDYINIKKHDIILQINTLLQS